MMARKGPSSAHHATHLVLQPLQSSGGWRPLQPSNTNEKIYTCIKDIAPVHTCVIFLNPFNIKGNGDLMRAWGTLILCPKCGVNFFLPGRTVPYEAVCPKCGFKGRVSHRKILTQKNYEGDRFHAQTIRILMKGKQA
jgi:predicted RNA-binding Zn-ribbon protein involved in translation (DUF1610 family)